MSTERGYAARRQQVRSFITSFVEAHGYPPTIREIAAGIGLSSYGAMYEIIERMRREGEITHSPKQGRTIRLRDATLPAEGETL